MKKISTAGARQNKNFAEQKLTIGLDLGDRSSWYCVLDEAGEVVLEQRLGTTPKVMKEVFAGHAAESDCVGNGNAFAVGESGVERVGTRSNRGACAQRALDWRESKER